MLAEVLRDDLKTIESSNEKQGESCHLLPGDSHRNLTANVQHPWSWFMASYGPMESLNACFHIMHITILWNGAERSFNTAAKS